MFLPGVTLTTMRPAALEASTRADVAMFVGCIARRDGALPEEQRAELERSGWSSTGLFEVSAERLQALLDIPVAVDSWSEFDSLFAWDRRPAAPGSSDLLPTPLGLAVKNFFEEGGAKAYIVRTGDPLPLADPARDPDEVAKEKLSLLNWAAAAAAPDASSRTPILPGYRGRGAPPSPTDPKTWTGAALIYAIDDTAMLLLPDLIDLCSGEPHAIPAEPQPPAPPEQFRPCATDAPQLEPEPRAARPEYRAARLDVSGYREWASALRYVLDLLGRPRGPAHRHDVMLLSAFPLPLGEAGFDRGEESWPLAILGGLRTGSKQGDPLLLDADGIGNARLQLAYPWIETAASFDLPEGLQSPEGVLAGMVARTALAEGAFRSAAGRPCRSPRRLHPEIATSDLARGLPGSEADWLGARLSIIGHRRGAIELMSDSTMATDRRWRAGGVSRLMGILLRAARHLGDELIFEPNGPHLWARVRSRVEALLEDLWNQGALEGRNRGEAYEVYCDESSMSATDIDAGRVICRIGFTAAYPIERINVSLLLLEAPTMSRKEAA